MEKEKPIGSAPALERGIQILQILQDLKSRTLEELNRLTSIPKSSLLRLLETLERYQLVTREEKDKSYRAKVILVPLTHHGVPSHKIQETLHELAYQLHQTAEWYLPHPKGMILTQRAEPPDMEVLVAAKVGFLRIWSYELEAVCALGHAFFAPEHALDFSQCNLYLQDGIRSLLTKKEVLSRIEEARRCKIMIDRHWNQNGVRRIASVLFVFDKPIGILALAEVMRPSPVYSQEEVAEILVNRLQVLQKDLEKSLSFSNRCPPS